MTDAYSEHYQGEWVKVGEHNVFIPAPFNQHVLDDASQDRLAYVIEKYNRWLEGDELAAKLNGVDEEFVKRVKDAYRHMIQQCEGELEARHRMVGGIA